MKRGSGSGAEESASVGQASVVTDRDGDRLRETPASRGKRGLESGDARPIVADPGAWIRRDRRPSGRRFGVLVHALLAAVPLDASREAIAISPIARACPGRLR